MKHPQVTLRDLFWLATLVALACGWWLDRQGLFATNKALIEFYETPIQFDGPSPAVESALAAESVTTEPLIIESEFHERQFEGGLIQ